MTQFYFINGQIVPSAEARLHVTDLAITRGYGIFDFLRTSNGKPLFIDDHIKRFRRSAALFHLEFLYTDDQIKDAIQHLLKKNAFAESGIKLVLTGGYSKNGFDPGEPNFVIMVDQLPATDPSYYSNGVKLITLNHLREFPEVKSTNYLTAVISSKKCKEEGAIDVLFHDGKIVSEVTRSNIFIIKNKIVITPDTGILKGITRSKVIDLAKEHYTVEVRPVGIDEMYAADEIFITSSTKRIMPVVNIDGKKIGDGIPGPVSHHLYDLFIRFELESIASEA